nr:MAG TPA: hypothetical protein [Caudoviricetes sp.]
MVRPNSSDAHRRIAVDIHVDIDIDGITVLDRLIGSGECSRGVLGYGMLSHRRDGIVDAHTAISRRIDEADVDVAATENSGGNSRLLGIPISVREENAVGHRVVLVADELHVFVGGENKRCRVA